MISIRFASQSEGRKLKMAHDEYFNALTQNDLNWRMRSPGATLEDFKRLAENQIKEFSEAEKTQLEKIALTIEQQLHDLSISLPFHLEVTLVKSGMNDEFDFQGYTHGNEIYLSSKWVDEFIDETELYLAHELFHCITRTNPDFRRQMYDLIGFTIMSHDIEFKPNLRQLLLTNPDVEHNDNYAEFTINGIKRKCELVGIFPGIWEDGKNEELSIKPVLVPIDDTGLMFPVEEVEDFKDVIGNNTDYYIAPEECLAENFRLLIVNGSGGKTGAECKTPLLISKMLDVLRKFH